MKKSTKFSDVLHILLHMAKSPDPSTSKTLAKAMNSNPVVVRRIMAGLRKQGLVQSEKGHGGGWSLSCNLKTVTLHDIYEAIGAPTMLAIGNRAESPACFIEKAVNSATGHVFQDAKKMIIAQLQSTTVADLQKIIKNTSHTHNHGKKF